jgi:hypothetical protein
MNAAMPTAAAGWRSFATTRSAPPLPRLATARRT